MIKLEVGGTTYEVISRAVIPLEDPEDKKDIGWGIETEGGKRFLTGLGMPGVSQHKKVIAQAALTRPETRTSRQEEILEFLT